MGDLGYVVALWWLRIGIFWSFAFAIWAEARQGKSGDPWGPVAIGAFIILWPGFLAWALAKKLMS